MASSNPISQQNLKLTFDSSLGVSMVRSMLTHGLLWTIVDWAGAWIDTKPFERLATPSAL